jgi:hypothetical protein
MIRHITVVAACALCNPAGAGEAIYKCTEGGKVMYSEHPCARGKTVALPVPAAPAPSPEAAQQLARARAAVAALEQERAAREAREEREAARQRRAAAAQGRKCARLRLQRKWADEDLARATGAAAEAARIKARRQAEALAVECPA